MLFQQKEYGENHGLIGDPIVDQLDPAGYAAHGRHIHQCFFHRRVDEGMQMLLQVIRGIVAKGYGGRPPFLLALW